MASQTGRSTLALGSYSAAGRASAKGCTEVSQIPLISRSEALAQGATRYFTGKPCKFGHVSERQVTNLNCCDCSRLRRGKWRIENEENEIIHRTRYYNRHKQDISVSREAYYARNKERILAYDRARYALNKEARFAYCRNRRARKRGNGGKHSKADIVAIVELQRGRCALCKIKLKGIYHVDHIIPLSLGGANGRKNLQILCSKCNLAKGRFDPLEYNRKRGLLL
jgi:5-methylcytosine-specific restriction endonuclease McrA